jgi:flagellar biosynthetic protein FliR
MPALEQFIVSQIFSFFIIFCRIGSGLIVLPGFGETYVSPRIRLSIALAISFLLTPVLGKLIPALPSSSLALALLVISEILIGIFIGFLCNILISVTHVAGMIFSFQAGVSSAVVYDVSQSSQGSLIGNFLGMMTIVLLFTTNLHLLMLRGITESYSVFIPGQFPPLAHFVEAMTRLLSDSFVMAVQITMPIIVVATLLFLGAGILSRLMPTIQVFFLITSPQLLIGFFIFTTTFSAMMLWYMEFYREKLTWFLGFLK